MSNFYSRLAGAAGGLLLLAPAAPAHAQAPVLTILSPAANARAVPRNAAVMATFSQPLTTGSAGALKVFSAQRGGLRSRGTTPATISGSTLRFAPQPYDFRPGEIVAYTVTTAAASSTGTLARPQVGQFTTAVAGPGRGSFVPGFSVNTGTYTESVAAGDLDGDGDLDLVAANANLSTGGPGTVSVRFNNGAGVFSGTQNVAVGRGCYSVALGDVDGDGDLDFVTANFYDYTASVRLNDGTGTFAGTQEVAVGLGAGNFPGQAALADVDGDGDLDLLVACGGNNGLLSVRLNNGTGTFRPGFSTGVSQGSRGLAVGDLDGDGDLDVVLCNNRTPGLVDICLNDGTGTFGPAGTVAVGNNPYAVELADLDGDGDLDLATANGASTTASVRLNNGAGAFAGTLEVPVNTSAPNAGSFALALGDVDADGDTDLLVADTNGGNVSVRFNNGTGNFTSLPSVPLGTGYDALALADLDSDGDLDLLAGFNGGTAVACLNGGTGPLATTPGTAPVALAAYPNPATGRVALTLPPAAARAELLDPLGRVVRVVPAQAGIATLDVAGLAPGLYVVRAIGQVARLVVE